MVGNGHLADVVQRAGQVDQPEELAVDLADVGWQLRQFLRQDPAVAADPFQVQAGSMWFKGFQVVQGGSRLRRTGLAGVGGTAADPRLSSVTGVSKNGKNSQACLSKYQ